MNSETGEIDLDEALPEMYQANGRQCELGGCAHVANQIYELYGHERREGRAYIFLCGCCVKRKRKERAEWYAKQVPKLTAEYEKEKESCATKQETPTLAAPASA